MATVEGTMDEMAVYEMPNEMREKESFHFFSELHEDIANHILLFIAEAPLERSTERGKRNALSSLTHTIPLVSKAFRDVSRLDFFWKESLLRQLNREDSKRHHWQLGFRRLLPHDIEFGTDSDKLDTLMQETGESCYMDVYKNIMTT